MKRMTAWILTLATFLTVTFPAGAASIDTGMLEKAPLGAYGSYLYIGESSVEPQSYIYNMLYAAIAGKNPETIDLTWEATPLHASTYLRDEAMLALDLDHPELNLGKYRVDKFEAVLAGAYNAKFTFQLSRDSVPDTSASRADAASTVAAADGSYAKAKAAFDWLMAKAKGGGGITAEDAFTGPNANYVGLTKAFKLLMDGAGVDCVLGRNGLSTWAYVKMNDEKYYVVDFKKAVNALEPTRWFLCGDEMYTDNESFPYYMTRIGQGSGLSNQVSSISYVAESEQILVEIRQPDVGGTIQVFYGNRALKSGDSVPSGATLTIKATPETSYYVDISSLGRRLDLTRTEDTFEAINVRTQLIIALSFNQEELLPPQKFSFSFEGRGSVELTGDAVGTPETPVVITAKDVLTIPHASAIAIKLVPDFGYQVKYLKAEIYDEFNSDTMTWEKPDDFAYYFWRKGGNPHGDDGINFELAEDTLECYEGAYVSTDWDVDLTAVFEPLPDNITISVAVDGHGTVLVEQKDGPYFVPLLDGSKAVKGTDLRVTLVPEVGYQVSDFTSVPEAGSGSGQVYEWSAVNTDVTLTASFVPIPTVPVTAVTLNKSALSLKTGASETLTATVAPEDASDKSVAWSSSAPAVAGVDAAGKVTANAPGSATITVATADGAKTATCAVTVTAADSGQQGGGGTGGGGGGSASKPIKTEGSISVKPADIQTALADALRAGEDTVILAPALTADAQGTVSVTFPAKALAELGESALRLNLPSASVTLPSTTLSTLKSSGATFILTQKEGTVTLSAASGGKDLADLPLTLTLPGADYGPGIVALAGEAVIRKSVPTPSGMIIPLDGPTTITIQDRSKSFPDTEAHWAADAVAFVTARDLFGGVSADSFAPDMPMNRAMLATVLYRLEDAPVNNYGNAFPDVADTAQYYYDAVSWAAHSGIVSGTGDGFAPNDPVNREQIAVILCHYAQWLGRDVTPKGDLSAFPDADTASPWAADALAWAVDMGLLTGTDGGALAPQSPATRAQVATLFQRLIKSL